MTIPHRGHGYSSSRTYRSPSGNSASIVTRLECRALIGNSLQLNIHQHLGYTVHASCRTDAVVTSKYLSAVDMCFGRVFDKDDDCDAFYKELRLNPIDGICDCMGAKEYM